MPKLSLSALVFIAFLSGCGGGKLAKMSNADLAAKRSECMRSNPTSPGRVTACENIKKECERRRKDGNYTC